VTCFMLCVLIKVHTVSCLAHLCTIDVLCLVFGDDVALGPPLHPAELSLIELSTF